MQFKFDKPEGKSKGTQGCLYGCTALLLLIMLSLAGGYFYFRDRISGIRELENQEKQLTEQFGETGDFTPAADGSVPPERVKLFISIRDELKPVQEKAIDAVSKLSKNVEGKDSEDTSFGEIFDIVTESVDLVPDIMKYVSKRNSLLLEKNMHPGEYLYIYSLAYYNYLGHTPGDGPDFKLVIDHNQTPDSTLTAHDVLVKREQFTRDKLNHIFRKILKNQVIAATQTDDKKLVNKIRNELDVLLENPYALPWESSLPESIKNSFSPFENELETSYNEKINPLEILPFD